jgi:hypothetical protein
MKRLARVSAAACLLLNSLAVSASAQNVVFTNPVPAMGAAFGFAVAALGKDRLYIGTPYDNAGASSAGAAYVYNSGGKSLSAITNPYPSPEDYLGWSFATLGNDRVIIGAPYADGYGFNAGAAVMYDTNNTLLSVFVNPNGGYEVWAGETVAVVGNDLVLLGADGDDTGFVDSGAAYLFNTNGVFLFAFTNPTPAASDYFGCAVAGLGRNRVLIGAYRDDAAAVDAGAAYMYNTNGILLRTFLPPHPRTGDGFGASVAPVGDSFVLIGGLRDDAGLADATRVYLYRTNGSLVTTFTNPAPALHTYFGYPVKALANDRVLIGSVQLFDDTGTDPGRVYLFHTNGTLLATFVNPDPANGGHFGHGFTPIGTNRVLFGAWGDNTGAPGAGKAYLFALSTNHPHVNIAQSNSNVSISWVDPDPGWVLEETYSLSPGPVWNDSTAVVTITGSTNMVVLPAAADATNRFFRLRWP